MDRVCRLGGQMKATGKAVSPRGTVIALFVSAVGALCLFVAVMVTIHAVEDGGRLNQAFSLTLKWFKQISETNNPQPDQEASGLQADAPPESGSQ